MVPFIRSPFNYDRDAVSDETGLRCEDASLAKQSFAEECDINTIVRRFGLTGELPRDIAAPQYGDFLEVVDFHTAMNAIAKAGEAFDAMPAEVRYRFGNDPGKFVDFCSDPANRDEAVKLGLVVPKDLPPPIRTDTGVTKGPEAPVVAKSDKVESLPLPGV